MSFCRFCLVLAIPWLTFNMILQINSVSVSLIKFMIMQQPINKIGLSPHSSKQKLITA